MKRSVSAFVKPAFTVVFSFLTIGVIAQTTRSGNMQRESHHVQKLEEGIVSSQRGVQVSRDAQIAQPSSVLKVDKKTQQRPTAANEGDGVVRNPVVAETPPEVINALYRGVGLYRGFNHEDELTERRTSSTKHFRNQDGTVTAIVGAGPLHYEEDGQWKEILTHVLPNNSGHYNQYDYAVVHNAHKLYLPRNPGEPIVAKIGNEVYRDWGKPGMVWLDAEANVVSEVLLNKSSVGLADKDSLRYEEIFPKVDAIIKNSVTSKKLSYLLKDPSILADRPAEAVFLAFRETISTGAGWRMVGNESEPGLFESEALTVRDILFEDAMGGAILEIASPVYYEEIPLQSTACSDPSPVDTTANYSGNYLVKQTNSDYELYTLVPIDWLTNPNRDFPLIIDPTTSFYPGGTWPTYTAYRSGNSGSWACASGTYAGRANYYDISYGWIDDTWPTSNPYLDGYATFDISALQNNDCVSAVTYFWYHYAERNCGTDISLKFGEVQFNANLAEEPDCNVTGIRVRNNNNYYSGTGKNSNGWKNQVGNVADFGLAMPGNQITLGWAYNGGDDCCSTLCSGDDGNYHHVYGYQHSTAKPYASVTYTVASNAAAAAVVSINPTCPGQSTTLSVVGGSLGTSASWEWYTGSCGGTSVGSGASIAVSPATTTTYYVRAEGACNTTGCVSVTVNVTNTTSTAAASASASISPTCPSQSTSLSVSGGSLGTGANWNWYSGSCGGTSVGTGSPLSVAPTVTTTYYARAEGTCNTTSCVSVTVTVNTNSAAATSASASVNPICPSQSTTLSLIGGTLGTGATWNWYSSSCGVTLEGTGTSISVSPATTTTYYVRAEGTCNITTCASVTVIVNSNSTVATSASASVDPICDGNSTTLSVTGGALGTGANWTWYSGSCGGTLEGTGVTLSVSPSTTTTYYVRAEGACNTTACVSVTVTVNSLSVAATSASASVNPSCEGQPTTLSITGGTLGTGGTWNWYSGSCGGTMEGAGTSISVSPTTTTTYYVRAEGTCNTTTCVSVTVIVNSNSTVATSASASVDPICDGNSTTLSVTGGALGTGANWTWYSGSCGGTLEGTGVTLSVSPSTTTTYYVRAEGACNTTACVSVTVTVNSLSVAATSASASVNPSCEGQPTTLSFTGGSLGTGGTWNWYSGSCGGTLEGTGTSISVSPTVTTTYYIRAEGTCNTTACISVTVVVNTNSIAATGATTSVDPICDGSSTTLSVTGGTLGTGADWSWYTVSCGGTLEGTGSSIAVSPSTTTTYYVRAEGTCNTTNCVSVTVTVDAVPTADAGSGGSTCDLQFTFGASPSIGTGTWTQVGVPPSVAVYSPNANSPTAMATVTAYGTYFFRWTEVNAGCSDFDDIQVDFYEQPAADPGTGDTACGTLDHALGAFASVGTGTWTIDNGPGTATYSPDANTANATATVSTTGLYTFEWREVNGVCDDSATVVVLFADLPAVSYSGLGATYCISNTNAVPLTPSPVGGVFSGNGIVGNDFFPNLAAVGTNVITYTYTDGNGCTNSVLGSTIIIGLPVVSFSGLNGPYCEDDIVSVPLTGFPVGGVFSGPGVSGSSFTPATAGNGLHVISYTYTDGNGCVNSDDQSVNVTTLPLVTFSGLDTAYCLDAVAVTLSGVPSGGVFTGPGISGSTFDPAIAGVGTHSINYAYSDGNGCSSDSTRQVTVNVLPVVTFSGLNATYCIDDTAAVLVGNPLGGTFSGTGVSGGTFVPSVADTGSHAVTYVYTDGNGCTGSQVQGTVVTPLPVVSFSGLLAAYCESAATDTLTGSPVGGTFSGPGMTTNVFDPAVAGAGTHSIVYVYSDGSGCTDSMLQSVVVNALPAVTFSGLDTAYCLDASLANLVGFIPGGIFTGVGVSGSDFDPGVAGLGSHTITYTYTDGNGCTDSAQSNTVVNTLPVVTFTGLDTAYCVSAGGDVLAGTPAGGFFSGNGMSGSSFFPVIADTGIHVISYTFSDSNSCSSSQTDTTNVVPGPIASFTGLNPTYCVDVGTSNLTGLPTGGTFSGPGISGNTFDPAAAGVGTHAVKYVVVDTYGCGDSTSQTVVVLALPAVTFSGLDAEYCVDGLPVNLIGFPLGGTFSGTGVSGSTFDPASAGIGTHNITYSYTDGNGCTRDTTLATLVNPLPAPVIVASGPTSFCQGGSVDLSAGTWVTYAWSTAEMDSSIVVTSPGSYTVQVMDTNLCLGISALFSISVDSNPTLTTTSTNANCVGGADGTATVTASGGTGPYTYMWNDSNSQTDSVATGLSSGTYTVTVEDVNGCVGIDSATVLEPTTPLTASISTIDVSCNGGSDGAAIGLGSGGTTPYSFQWDDGSLQTTDTAQGLTAGMYTMVITDVNGCTWMDTGFVSEPAAVSGVISSTPISCNGGQDGSAAIAAQGGVSPYNYLWDGGQTDPVIISLDAGTYGVTVTDANGCQSTDIVNVTEPAILTLVVSEIAVTCGGISNGMATVVASGGNPPYNYLWDDGQTTSVAVGLGGGLVSVDVVDSKGCNASIGTSITASLPVTSTTTAQNATLGNSDGSGTVLAAGGIPPYAYQWSGGQTSSAVTGLSPGAYIVGIEDSVGCTVTDTVIIEVAMIDAATAFTPNSDGANDFWTIGDMSLYPNVEVTIMGRWGQMIFNSIGYEEPWDGTYQGKELPMGSYFFIIDLKEGSKPLTGSVTIMR